MSNLLHIKNTLAIKWTTLNAIEFRELSDIFFEAQFQHESEG